MEYSYVLLALVIAIGAIALAASAFFSLRAGRARVSALEADLRSLCNAAVTVGERIKQLEQRERQLNRRLEEIGLRQDKQNDADARSLDQAVKMVRKGASVDELVEICGLARGEAELVMMMHRLNAQETVEK